MTWLQTLERALRDRRVPGRSRGRILAEYREHLRDAGDGARLGDPVALAADLAHESAIRTTFVAVWGALAALAVTAAVLVGTSLALPTAPGLTLAAAPAVLVLFVAPQLALVAGGLALVRVLRRRRAHVLSTAELRLVRRRVAVALAAGAATAGALIAYALVLSGALPGWWLALAIGLSVCALAWLSLAALVLRAAGRIATTVPGPAGVLGDDLPALRGLAARPGLLWAATAAVVGVVATAGFGVAEASAIEGLERGVAEVLALTACFWLVGRRVGVRR
jgi:hypothetical protein